MPDPDRRTNSPLRGPLARLDRSRDELAKAWLVRVIGRASLDEIKNLPTDRIAAQLPDLFSDVLAAAAGTAIRSRCRRRPTSARPGWPSCARPASPRPRTWPATSPPSRA